MRILVVEDDRDIGTTLQRALRADDHAADWVLDGRSAETALQQDVYDLALLDLGLPHKDGIEVLRTLRARHSRIPVLVLTARDTPSDVVRGLDAGADDYLVKPFDLDVLLARVRALARRSAGRAEPLIAHLDVTLDTATHEVTRGGHPVELAPKEFALLQALLARPGAVLSRAQLEEKLYGWGEEIESNAVEVYIHGLRRKLGQDFIRNVRGVGYMVPKSAPAGKPA
ncbi:MAG TPA: response regulator transcription factor [Burkholderiales bacterium]|nr:response regulator transcription factor [Burkholderiales bacterium]